MKSNLTRLGLSDEESKIYLMLLEYGTSTASNISRITKIGRVNCYHHLEKLLQKGLISQSRRLKVKEFTAESPKTLINKQIESLNFAKTIVPELLAISAHNPKKPRIQFFEGKDGIKNVFHEMLTTKPQEIVSFSNFTQLSEFLPEFLPNHFKERIQQGIKTRFISPRNETSDQFVKRFFPADFDEHLLEVFLISSKEFNFSSEITIFAGSIAIINLNETNPVAVLIENPELYHTQKAIFDLAWLGATSFITQ